MMIFGVLLNCNELSQCYDLIGCIVLIFGSYDLETTEEVLDGVIKVIVYIYIYIYKYYFASRFSFQAGANFLLEFEEFFEDDDNITKAEKEIEQELAELDDVFLSSEPILHQSPFTKLARERSPILAKLMDKSKKR
jgi:hypothetical protein